MIIYERAPRVDIPIFENWETYTLSTMNGLS